MAITSGNQELVRTGVGTIYAMPFGTTLPSEHDDAIPAEAWKVGYTVSGSERTTARDSAGIEVAEVSGYLRQENTSATTSISFEMAQVSLRNLKLAFNGGTITDGANGRKFSPPAPSAADSRVSIIIESDDGKERWVGEKGFCTGDVSVTYQKSPDYQTQSIEITFEPTEANPAGWYVTHSLDYGEDDLELEVV